MSAERNEDFARELAWVQRTPGLEQRLDAFFRAPMGGSDPAERLRQADTLLGALDRAATAFTWGAVQRVRADCFLSGALADPEINRIHAEEAVRLALGVYAGSPYSGERALLFLDLGEILRRDYSDTRAVSLEEALGCYDSAAEVFTREVSPPRWAVIEHARALVYADRLEGDRIANLREARACLQRALEVFAGPEQGNGAEMVRSLAARDQAEILAVSLGFDPEVTEADVEAAEALARDYAAEMPD